MNWPAVVAVVGLFGLALSALTFYGGWVASRTRGEDAAKAAKSAHQRIDAFTKELADFKAEVARDYASNRMIEQMEARLVTAINRLGDRLDRVFLAVKE